MFKAKSNLGLLNFHERKWAVKAVKLPGRTYSPMPTSNVTMEENREGRDSPCWIKGP